VFYIYFVFTLLFIPLVIGIVEAIIARIWFRTMAVSLWIVVGAIAGSWIAFALDLTFRIENGGGFSRIDEILLIPLWKNLFGENFFNYGNFALIFVLLINKLLIQILGSMLGGLLGLSIWLFCFRA
jgi:hypothetical protein